MLSVLSDDEVIVFTKSEVAIKDFQEVTQFVCNQDQHSGFEQKVILLKFLGLISGQASRVNCEKRKISHSNWCKDE